MKKEANRAAIATLINLSRGSGTSGKTLGPHSGAVSRFIAKIFKSSPQVKAYNKKRMDDPGKKPSFMSRHKTKFTIPGTVIPIGWGVGAAAAASVGGPDEVLPPATEGTSTELNPPLTGVQRTLLGGTAGGLGSLLYGTLADKPDLRRDLIATLLGAAAGGAYHLLSSQKSGANANAININARTATLDKEAALLTLAGLAAAGKVIGAGSMLTMALSMIYSHRQADKQQKQTERHARQGQRMHDEAIDEYKGLQQSQLALSQSQDKLRRGAGGALAGGAVGGLVSNIAGKAMDRESLQRDIFAAIGGAAIGGVAGVYSAA